MTNAQMIAAILAAIQTQANLTTLLQLMISNNIGNVQTAQLQAMCKALGIDYVDPPTS
jgi:hypothetical protein